jgi:hypothetical protein
VDEDAEGLRSGRSCEAFTDGRDECEVDGRDIETCDRRE